MKRFFTAFALFLMGSSVIFAANTKLSPDLQSADPRSNIRVIVQYAPTRPNSSFLDGVLKDVTPVTNILKMGGVVSTVSDVLNAVVCTMPVSMLERLAADPTVTYITPDRTIAARLDYTAAAVNAASAWKANLDGTGVGIALIDSGIDATEDLKIAGLLPRIVYSQDFTGGDGSDEYGHGTHVAGIAGANGISSKCLGCTRSLVGMAPNASFINLRVLDASGQGSDSWLIAAIGQAIHLKNVYNIRVINLSLGRPVYESYKLDPVCKAVEAAWKAGIVVVVAAGNDGRDNSVGNDGYGTIESPGNDPYVITVGAMKAMGTYPRSDDLIASYSSKGPSAIDHVVKPDVVAPGNHLVSLLAPYSALAGEPANQVPLSYYEKTLSSQPSTQFLMLNGTSMATPVVSGVVADLLQQHPSLTPDQVKARLMKTAYKTFPATSTAVDPVTGQTFVSQYDIFTIGAGYLDVAAALANHDLATGTAMSPTASYDSASGTVYIAYDPSATWQDTDGALKAVWGSTTVWGNSVIDANKAVWGSKAVWGTNSVGGFSTVWGNKSIWGSSTTSADKAVWGSDSSTSDSDTDFTINQPLP
jgi:serine protease AprX